MAFLLSGVHDANDEFATITLQPSSRMGVIYRLFNAGRWLAQTGMD